MAKLKKNHFYYGAILDALCQYNPDASPVLMSHEESRQVYRVMTNTSQECILFLKYASPKTGGKNEQDISYLFTFSDDDKQKLKAYMDKYDCPIFLYLLCKQPDLKDSEIIVLKYEEYQNVEENRAITIRIQKSKNYILLFKKGSRARDNAYQIPRNRIEKTFDELADDFMKESSPHAKNRKVNSSQMDFFIATSMEIFEDNRNCPFCDNALKDVVIHNSGDDMDSRMCPVCKRRFVNKRQYKIIRKYCGNNNIIPELYIMDFREDERQNKAEYKELEGQSVFSAVDRNKFYIVEDESDVCPIHNCKMEIRVINFGMKQKDTVHFCKRCNKYIIFRKQYDFLKIQCAKGGKRIFQNAQFEKLI
ncbi:MAG: hypothetical protein IJE43_25285 [Alphaproteobacteria bacterium]|nr:hypothetical protein [Alphaproteobacteria bacterium]MBQ3514828.1 hypothetical protein [Lachnospiraceae bacterium]